MLNELAQNSKTQKNKNRACLKTAKKTLNKMSTTNHACSKPQTQKELSELSWNLVSP